MLKKITFALLSLLLCTSLLIAYPLSTSAVEEMPAPEQTALQTPVSEKKQEIQAPSFQEAVNGLFQQLASREGFEDWKPATWSSYPLGPGTHGWVILISSGGKEAGYMVIHSAGPNSYRLTEYGKGDFPLFSLQTLYRSLVQLELIEYPYEAERLYYDPLQAIWKITVPGADRQWYLDAKTGEELPFKNDSKLPKFDASEKKIFTKIEFTHTIVETRQTLPADPYQQLPWVNNKSESPIHFGELKQWVEKKIQPVYAAQLYQNSVTIPLSVSGYQVWSDGDSFVEVLQEDTRYLPFDTMNQLGRFYP